jgi:hypothetical protein
MPISLPRPRFLGALFIAALLLARPAFGDAVLLSGSTGVAQLGRSDLPFNFQGDDSPGVDGLPFRIMADTAKLQVFSPNDVPIFTYQNGAIIGDCGGKFTVTLRWFKGAAPYEANRVYADVTIANRLPEPIQDYVLFLLKLKFPTPIAANDGNPNMRAYNTGSPGILMANYGGPLPGALVCDLEGVDASEPLLMKMERGNATDVKAKLNVMNHHDSEDGGSPFPYWPIPAMGTVHFRIGLRFVQPLPDPTVVCPDLFAAFARRYPMMRSLVDWRDRRPIAQVFFESNDTNHGRNPRKWFSADQHVDVTNPSGVKRFQKLVLDRARDTVKRMQAMNAQGVITWDLEGAQFPAATFMGDPSMVATADPAQSVAPEMAGVVDQYFKIYRDAGYRVGMTIRPQEVGIERDAAGHIDKAWESDEYWDWKSDPPPDIQDFWQHQLERKIRFAQQRWGATLFYIDSNGGAGSPVSFLVMRNLAAEFPGVLLIPEESTMGYYTATAPYRQLNMLTNSYITSPVIRRTYMDANGWSPCFSVINPTIESMTATWPRLIEEMRQGDILFFRGWYDAAELPAIRQVYAASHN